MMNFNKKSAEVWVPDGSDTDQALARTTHLAIAAHPDDLEIMAIDGILKTFGKKDRWFCGVLLTDGSGSPREGKYRNHSEEEMRRVRKKEQKKAAQIGEYGALVFLDYKSSAVKDPDNKGIVSDITTLLLATKPEVIYTHNPADKHDTHVAVTLKVISAIRSLPPESKPGHLYGCEAWCDLDWLPDEQKVIFDVTNQKNLQEELISVFDSQISGGKRYDLAVPGRRSAHATFFQSHQADRSSGLVFAMDLTPLVHDSQLSVDQLVQEHINRFTRDILERIRRLK